MKEIIEGMSSAQNKTRSFLFLQGMSTPFFHTVAEKLSKLGHDVHKVQYSIGDKIFWRKLPSSDFTGSQNELEAYYRDLIQSFGIDTIILFGDCRPVHLPAKKIARELGLNLYVCEEGYFRPGWITFEHGGTGTNSACPRDLDEINSLAALLPETRETTNYGNPMPRRVRMELLHHIANFLNFMQFPKYASHRPEAMWAEAFSWAKKIICAPFLKGRHNQLAEEYETKKHPFFLVPLQLNSDYQIRIHSKYNSVKEFIDEVMQSFASHSNKDFKLLFKRHPLDNGRIDYARYIQKRAIALGIAGRVDFLIGGDLENLLRASRGVVLVNSTVGFAALKMYKPVMVTGHALYDIAGLSFTGNLDEFWENPASPKKDIVENFMKVLIAQTQIPGDLFTPYGIETAANAATDRLLAPMPEKVRADL